MIEKNQKGIALLITIMMLGLIFVLSLYFLSLSLTEYRISNNQRWNTKAYYLAEAGLNQMIWLIENDDTYKEGFEREEDWSTLLENNNPFGDGYGSYTVSIDNQDKANAVIVSTGRYQVGENNVSQSTIRLNVGKIIEIDDFALTSDGAIYSSNYSDIVNSSIVFNGSIFTNGNFLITGTKGTVAIMGDVNVVGNFNYSGASDVYIEGVVNNPAEPIEISTMDFDSEDPGSFKNRADVIYTPEEFSNLLASGDEIVLDNFITYVEGSVIIPRGKEVIINGALVLDGMFEMETCNVQCKESDRTSITINHIEGEPSGIIAKDDINLRHNFITLNSNGLLFSNTRISIAELRDSSIFNVNGGLMSNTINFDNISGTINIFRDGDVFNDTLRSGDYSPLIIGHYSETSS